MYVKYILIISDRTYSCIDWIFIKCKVKEEQLQLKRYLSIGQFWHYLTVEKLTLSRLNLAVSFSLLMYF